MLLLILFALIAGIVTILSPCILPVLPVILSGTVGEGKRKPLGIIFGFILSFTFFTLFLSAIVKSTNLNPDILRGVSVAILFLFGTALFIPAVAKQSEKLFSKLTQFAPRSQSNAGFFSGVLIGLSLGLLWTPCVGPILAAVITLAATSTVTITTGFITLAYAIGTAIPMLIIMYTGRSLFTKIPQLFNHLPSIQKFFGFLMILTAIAIAFKADLLFQAYIISTFPQYGTGLTKFEYNEAVQKQLDQVQSKDTRDKTVESVNQQILNNTFPMAPELIPGGEWFNSAPLTLQQLRGKVVLVDFWTYTCINCQRTLPYLKSWHQKYADKGLVIIGVHSPEFPFEHDPKNLAKAISDFSLQYPIMQDNDFKTWEAYSNRAWPAKYLIDKNGRVRYLHEGEGEYDQTEKTIQSLLAETGADTSSIQINNPEYQVNAQTRETYLGSSRIEFLSSPEQIRYDSKPQIFSFPKNIPRNKFAYEGTWTLEPDAAQATKGAKLSLNFDAQQVFLVMHPQTGQQGKIKLSFDGQPLTAQQAGADVTLPDSTVTIPEDRLYKLIKLSSQQNHILTIEFLDNFTQVFAFTFG